MFHSYFCTGSAFCSYFVTQKNLYDFFYMIYSDSFAFSHGTIGHVIYVIRLLLASKIEKFHIPKDQKLKESTVGRKLNDSVVWVSNYFNILRRKNNELDLRSWTAHVRVKREKRRIPEWGWGYKFLRRFNYKIINNMLYLNKTLFQFGKTQSPLCSSCHTEAETTLHVFHKCYVTKILWNQLLLFFTVDCPFWYYQWIG